MDTTRMTRKQALRAAGGAGAALVVGRTGLLAGAAPAAAATTSCATVTPSMTEGPYWVDELLKRVDVRGGQAGVPLQLRIVVQDATNGCAPVAGADVDVWHANAYGKYSDESSNGTAGEQWLRGYQTTDANGAVSFTTIWPGWYQGRTIHIHVRVRVGSLDYTTQIFFEESDNAAVLTGAAPYSGRAPQLDPTKNANDSIYGGNAATNLLDASGSPSAGYSGTFTIMLRGGSSPTAKTDRAVSASLVSVRVVRANVALSLRTGEAVTATAALRRGGVTLGRASGKLAAGTHGLHVAVKPSAASGSALRRVTVTDAAGNTRVLSRRVTL